MAAMLVFTAVVVPPSLSLIVALIIRVVANVVVTL